MMAFITVEDLVGAVEVIVFPKDYEKNRDILAEESKVFISGRVSIGEQSPTKPPSHRTATKPQKPPKDDR